MVPLRSVLLGPPERRDGLRPLWTDPQVAMLSAEGSSLLEGLSLCRTLQPDLIVIAFGGDLESTFHGADGLLAANPMASLILVGARLDSQQMGLAMQRGIREVLGDPGDLPAALQRAQLFLSRVRGAKSQAEAQPLKKGKLLVVHAPKGGSGKSTLAVNLALALAAETPDEVCLAEVSPQFGEVALLLNVKPQAHLSDLAKLGPQPEAEAIEQALVNHSSGIKVLASTPSPEEGELITRQVTLAVLQELKHRHTYTVVDTSSHLSETLIATLEAADRILLPFFPELASLHHVQQSLRLWQTLGIDLEKVELVSWHQKSEIDSEAMARVLRRPLAASLPYAPEEVLAAINAGSPIFQASSKSPFCKALKVYAARFVEKPQTALVDLNAGTSKIFDLWARLRRMIDVSAQPT